MGLTGRPIITEDAEQRTLWTWSGPCPWAEMACTEPGAWAAAGAECLWHNGRKSPCKLVQARKGGFSICLFLWAIQLPNYTIQVVSETVSTMCLLNDGDKHEEVWLESTSPGKGNVSVPFHSAFGDLSQQKGKPGLEVPVGRLPSSFSSTPCNQLLLKWREIVRADWQKNEFRAIGSRLRGRGIMAIIVSLWEVK